MQVLGIKRAGAFAGLASGKTRLAARLCNREQSCRFDGCTRIPPSSNNISFLYFFLFFVGVVLVGLVRITLWFHQFLSEESLHLGTSVTKGDSHFVTLAQYIESLLTLRGGYGESVRKWRLSLEGEDCLYLEGEGCEECWHEAVPGSSQPIQPILCCLAEFNFPTKVTIFLQIQPIRCCLTGDPQTSQE